MALTFDDGPGAITGELLAVLADHGARATFNLLGTRIEGREEVVRRIAAAGHEIGVHGWDHADHRDSPAARAAAAARTADIVTAICGTRPSTFRPPFGLTDRPLELAMARHGLRTILWDVDPRDWEEPPAQVIRDRILDGIRPGSIVLLHDDRPELGATVTAVDAVLRVLRRRALATRTVSELLGDAAMTGERFPKDP